MGLLMSGATALFDVGKDKIKTYMEETYVQPNDDQAAVITWA